MPVTGILVGLCIAVVVVFAVARIVFGPRGAVLLTGAVGYGFGGPPGAGAGLVTGLVLLLVVEVLAVLFASSPSE